MAFVRRGLGLVLLLSVGLSTTACSLLFVHGPPSDPSEEELLGPPECTSSNALPVLDVTGVAASAANVGLVAASSNWSPDEKKFLIPLHAAYGVLYAISAVYGFNETAKCKAYKAKLEKQRPTSSPSLKQPPSNKAESVESRSGSGR